MKVKSVQVVPGETVYAISTSTRTYIADGVFHHNCNAWRDKSSMLAGYSKGLDIKYGSGTARRLEREASLTRKLSKDELLQIIHDSKEYINYTLEHEKA